MPSISLPTADGHMEPYHLSGTPIIDAAPGQPFSRKAYAAAHVVADPARVDAAGQPAIDWERTLAFRRHLWAHGFAIAEAMDTAQRGMGLAWPQAKELISRSLAEAKGIDGADLSCGAGTDQLDLARTVTLGDVLGAYEEQFEHIERHGGRAILMASRALASVARGPDDYARVYDRLLSQSRSKVILHWLGDMFDPALAGYWGTRSIPEATEQVLAIIHAHPGKVEGIKMSLLDAAPEIALRRRLPGDVLMFTGDDFNYAELIAGDDHGHSHALLGIFDPIAPAAAAALRQLALGNVQRYHDILGPTVALSRKIFETPTWNYKSGVVFLAWLNGHQDHFSMIARQETARNAMHYAEVFRLADRAGLLNDPDRAVQKMQQLLTG
jgi:Protein of unknown function (DUF993)